MTAEERHDAAAAKLAEEVGQRSAPHEPANSAMPEPAPAPVMTGGLDTDDGRSHVERINPGDNPAHIPGILMGPQPTDRQPYRVTQWARHGGDVILPPGTIVMLLPHEVCAHHEAVVEAEPVAEEAVAVEGAEPEPEPEPAVAEGAKPSAEPADEQKPAEAPEKPATTPHQAPAPADGEGAPAP